jgi:nucleotide-binding universal stress UspA family protein
MSSVLWQCPPKTVLVAVDFGDASARALAIGGVVASLSGARLRALHAERFEPPLYFTLEQIAGLEAERRAAQAVATDHLARFAAAASACRVEGIVVDESPVDAILNAATGADLIVAGTHGWGPGRWWLGSVAERIVRAATIPVLVTRAAATPPREIFHRIAFIQDKRHADSAARTCVEHLASIAGGGLIEGGPIAQCESAVIQRASLVVLEIGSARPSWGLTDSVAKVLATCQRPVMFIPVAETKL